MTSSAKLFAAVTVFEIIEAAVTKAIKRFLSFGKVALVFRLLNFFLDIVNIDDEIFLSFGRKLGHSLAHCRDDLQQLGSAGTAGLGKVGGRNLSIFPCFTHQVADVGSLIVIRGLVADFVANNFVASDIVAVAVLVNGVAHGFSRGKRIFGRGVEALAVDWCVAAAWRRSGPRRR